RAHGAVPTQYCTLPRAEAKNGAAMARNPAGSEENGTWPVGRTSSRDPGIAAAVARPNRMGIAVSFDPQTTRHGAVMRSACGRRAYSGAAKLRHNAAVRMTPS